MKMTLAALRLVLDRVGVAAGEAGGAAAERRLLYTGGEDVLA